MIITRGVGDHRARSTIVEKSRWSCLTVPPSGRLLVAATCSALAEPGRVLDLGCGDGRLPAVVLDARPDVQETIGIDASPRAGRTIPRHRPAPGSRRGGCEPASQGDDNRYGTPPGSSPIVTMSGGPERLSVDRVDVTIA